MTREQIKNRILDTEYWEIIYLTSDKNNITYEIIRQHDTGFKVHGYAEKTYHNLRECKDVDELMEMLDDLYFDYSTANIEGS